MIEDTLKCISWPHSRKGLCLGDPGAVDANV
jgi:hypothetical protein